MNFTLGATNTLSWIAAPPTPGGSLPPQLLDQDGNGLPDGWETLHGISDPDEDADGDGLTNLEEFLAGTDPRDEDDRLRLHALGTVFTPGPAAVLGVPARSNKTYTIIYRDLVEDSGWTNLVHIGSQPTNRFVTVTNSLPANTASRFYRLATPRLP